MHCKIEIIPLPSRYPSFVSYRVDGLSDLPIQGYDTRNKNRIFCPLCLRQHISTLYPDARLVSEQLSTSEGRLGCTEKLSVLDVFDKWAEQKQLPQVAKEIGRKYLAC